MLSNNADFSIAFFIGSFGVHWYSIIIFVAFVASYAASLISAKIQKISIKYMENFIFILFPVSIIFARVWFILGDLNLFIGQPFYKIFDIASGGIAIEGGIIGGLIAGYFWFKRAERITKVSMWVYADIIMPNILLGQMIGRWGNFFNQELLGPIANGGLPHFLPHFIKDHLYDPNIDTPNIIRQPLFLYESFFSFWGWITFAIVLPIWKRKHFILKEKTLFEGGTLFLSYFIYYGILRIIIEPFRITDYIMKIGPIPVSILLSAIFVLVGILGVILINSQKTRNILGNIFSNNSKKKESK